MSINKLVGSLNLGIKNVMLCNYGTGDCKLEH